MHPYLLTGLILLGYLILAWFIGPLTGVSGRDVWILRAILSLLGFVGAGVFIWFHRKTRKPAAGAAGNDKNRDLDVLLRQAEARLTSSKVGRGATFNALPVILFLGETGSSKTTLVTQSGLEPELLAGHVFRDEAVTPTDQANCWFSRGNIVLEAGGSLLSDPAAWARLLRKLKPGPLAALTRKAGPASRAAIVCVSVENFLTQDASKNLEALARKLRARLEETAHALGIRIPVYVLFTKTDRLPFFPEYVRNLSQAEASQVLGATLSVTQDSGESVWAEKETQRLDAAFRNLIYSLCDHRTGFLAREHDAAKLPALYEFPRELGKLRSLMVKFLVDLCKPSQLRITPFLRGFYFTGVRSIVLDERADNPVAMAAQASPDFSGATRIFRLGDFPAARPAPAGPPGGRKVPQWLFVPHFFNDVLLKDRVALGLSGSSTRTNALRRVVFASVSLLLLFTAIGMTISWFGNRSLSTQVLEAARLTSAAQPPDAAAPVLTEELTRLDTLRQGLETLTLHNQDGAPWRLRWGLYSGNGLYEDARSLYYDRFKQVLFGSVQNGMVNQLKGLPATPAPGQEYGPSYDLLKAYLITTSNSENSDKTFLAPILLERWAAGQTPDPATVALVQKQFDFYSDDLRRGNPYSTDADSDAVGTARRHLSQFAGIERVYQSMLAEAAKQSPLVSFSRMFPDAADVFVVGREVSGAYTKAGWMFMQEAVQNPERFFTGERWVLGEQISAGLSEGNATELLRVKYRTDFINQWQGLVKSATVARYGNIADGAKKLAKLSSSQSPLLALISLVSENTAVESPEVKAAFQSAQFVVPPGNPQQYIGENNTAYMKTLLQLQAALEGASGAPAGAAANDPAVTQVSESVTGAKLEARQLALNFGVDQVGHLESTIQQLMEAPITNAEFLVKNIVPGELNAKARALCSPLQDLMSRFPFNATATQQATVQQMTAAFQPEQGTVWAFYKTELSKHLLKQGTQYVENPESGVRISPAFLAFWNRVAAFTDAVYPNNSRQPRLAFSLKSNPVRGLDRVSLTIEGRSLNAPGNRATTQQFTWTGTPNQELRMVVRVGGGSELAFPTYEGPWALFSFFNDADTSSRAGAAYTFEWVFRQGRQGRPVTLPGGNPLAVNFELDMGGKPPVFQKGYLAGLRCVTEIARR